MGRRLGTAVLATTAVLAAVYGATLLLTLDREFAPRGNFGIGALVLAAILGGLAAVSRRAWR